VPEKEEGLAQGKRQSSWHTDPPEKKKHLTWLLVTYKGGAAQLPYVNLGGGLEKPQNCPVVFRSFLSVPFCSSATDFLGPPWRVPFLVFCQLIVAAGRVVLGFVDCPPWSGVVRLKGKSF